MYIFMYCMYVRMYVCILYASKYLYKHACTYVYLKGGGSIRVLVYICMYCMYVCMYCVYVCIYVCMYVCMYVCVCDYHTDRSEIVEEVDENLQSEQLEDKTIRVRN